jgi:hypothetical protein
VSHRDAAIRGGTVIVASMAGAFSVHGVVMTGVGEALVSCLLVQGRLKAPSPPNIVKNTSAESSIMAHHEDGVPLQV